MFQPVDTKVPDAVEKEVQSIYRQMFPRGDRAFVPRAFAWASECFTGRHGDYQAIDAVYHDFEHTLQGTLCLARLLQGRQQARARPQLTAPAFELVLLAILFHDTGYLKKRDDLEGTGAKYTPIHVGRSAVFAREFLLPRHYSEAQVTAIQNMIRCTGLKSDLTVIRFQSGLERILGFALATADMLGQMSAPDYVEKLPVLFREFVEAARSGYEGADRFAGYTSAADLALKTQDFWVTYALPRLNEDFAGLYKFLNDPYPDGPNPYLQRIEENLGKIRERCAGAAAASA